MALFFLRGKASLDAMTWRGEWKGKPNLGENPTSSFLCIFALGIAVDGVYDPSLGCPHYWRVEMIVLGRS
jgi:hypothetical protein